MHRLPWLKFFMLLSLVLPLNVCAFGDEEEDELGIDFSDEPLVSEQTNESQKDDDSLQFRGFLDTRWGTRFDNDPQFSRQITLAETRAQGHIKYQINDYKLNIKADAVYDDVIDGAYLDVREAYLELPSNPYMQVRIGRQNVVWGLGDLMAVNELFPKDFMGLYYGRDAENEYMVSASDGIRTSLFLPNSTLDLVYAQFKPWDVPTGERFSYFNPFLQRTAGEQNPLNVKEHDGGVLMTRWSRNLLGQEFALYFNRSRWQSPEGIDAQTGQLYHPRLNTYGFSVRGQAGVGIMSVEAAYYDSVEDKTGDNPLVRNSEFRYLLGYEFEVAKNFTASFQWYRENYKEQHPTIYDLTTLRLTKRLLNQKMTLSMFLFYSPTQNDSYLRFNLFHKFDDHWMVNVGTNHFAGGLDDRFGQLENNSNFFAAVRYSF